jgi:hypothetical protein
MENGLLLSKVFLVLTFFQKSLEVSDTPLKEEVENILLRNRLLP